MAPDGIEMRIVALEEEIASTRLALESYAESVQEDSATWEAGFEDRLIQHLQDMEDALCYLYDALEYVDDSK